MMVYKAVTRTSRYVKNPVKPFPFLIIGRFEFDTCFPLVPLICLLLEDSSISSNLTGGTGTFGFPDGGRLPIALRGGIVGPCNRKERRPETWSLLKRREKRGRDRGEEGKKR